MALDYRKYSSVLGMHLAGDIGDLTVYTNKRRRHVFFSKQWPRKPPSQRQLSHRNRFRRIADAWQRQTQDGRDRWNNVSNRCRLPGSGYVLFVWWHTLRDLPAMRTLERHSGIDLDL